MRMLPVGVNGEQAAVIERFVDRPDALRNAAGHAPWNRDARHYPGLRAPLTQRYLDAIDVHLRAALDAFGYPGRPLIQGAFLAMVVDPPESLTAAQSIPHFDASDDDQFAVVHYLHANDFGGTGFFRHRSTGFERITDARREPYFAALRSDLERHGRPARGYMNASGPIWERTTLFASAYNRALVYRGSLLHSGIVECAAMLDSDPMRGRLTATVFLTACR